MLGIGILLLILGAGSYVLPMMGMQFKLMSIFGAYQGWAQIGAIVVGAILVVMSLLGRK
ncbi:MAG TPA: hypothetical protein PK264_15695 [Hyphomicrobiaceae bacterium]|nr:hypothetical protein [Hyphomicrobiaceae bacterium]